MDELRGEVARPDEVIEQQADGCRDDGREQRVGDGVTEDAARVFLTAEHGQRRDDGKKNGRDGDKLEEARVDRRHKVHQLVEPRKTKGPEDGAHDEGAYPQDHLFPRSADRCFLFCVFLHDAKLQLFCYNKDKLTGKVLITGVLRDA